MTGFMSVLIVLQSILIVYVVKRLWNLSVALHLLATVTEDLIAEVEGGQMPAREYYSGE